MYTKIVVPLDGSRLSESILPYARSLAKALKVSVELLHAVDPEIISTFTNPQHGRYVDVVEADMKRKALDYLEPVAGSLPDPTAVSCSVEIGKAAELIARRAGVNDATLIVMASHGRSEVQRWFLGSVAHKVLLITTNPLFLVRPNKKLENTGVASLKKIVVPLDGSTVAEKILPHVKALAKTMNLEVILLRAYMLPMTVYYPPQSLRGRVWRQLVAGIREEAEQYLTKVVGRMQAEGLSQVSALSVEGEAAGEIIESARKIPDSFVAMCTHGRSGLERWVLGSVADRVVRHSGDPVLLIRP
jgi:nucleotide-binding universal stress UspA family protein